MVVVRSADVARKGKKSISIDKESNLPERESKAAKEKRGAEKVESAREKLDGVKENDCVKNGPSEDKKMAGGAVGKEEKQVDGEWKKYFVEDAKEEELRQRLYQENIKVKMHGKSDAFAKKEKNIQKSQKLTNRMKKFNEGEKDTILSDLSKLNVFMFLSELSSSLVEANLRTKDIMPAVEVCSALHQTYPNFHKLIASSILRAFQQFSPASENQCENTTYSSLFSSSSSFLASASASGSLSSNTSSNTPQKRRVLLRLYGELLVCGICEDPEPLLCMLNDVLSVSSATSNDDISVQQLTIIEMFCKKFGWRLMGLRDSKTMSECTPAENDEKKHDKNKTEDNENYTMVARKVQEEIHEVISSYFRKEARKILLQTYVQMTNQELVCEQAMVNKGSIDSENRTKCNAYKEKFNKVKPQIEALADLLNFPKISMEEIQDEAAQILGVSRKHLTMTRVGVGEGYAENDENKTNGTDARDDSNRWDDETEREFYSDILDLKEVIAPALFAGNKAEAAKENATEEDDGGMPVDGFVDKVEISPASSFSNLPSASAVDSWSASPPGASVSASSSSSSLMSLSKEEAAEELSLSKKFTLAISQLSEKQEVDKFAVDFFLERYNSRSHRKKLAKAMLVYQKSYHLPAVARLVATFHPYFKDISQVVIDGLQAEFKRFVSEKNPIQLEIKVRCMLYMGELVKFGVIPAGVALDSLNVCLEDLTNHHAEMACGLVQTCGRYLLYSRTTNTRFSNLLDKMLRICRVKNLPLSIEMQIEDLYFRLKAVNEKKNKDKKKPLLKAFIQHLIFVELQAGNEEKICKAIRKLPWKDPAVVRWLKKAFLDMDMNMNYEYIGSVAALLSILAKHKPDFVIECLDALLEEIQVGLERNDFRDAPRRVRHVRLLGEIFSYRILKSDIIFDTLYQLMGFSSVSCYKASDPVNIKRVIADTSKRYLATTAGKTGASEKLENEQGKKDGEGGREENDEKHFCLSSSFPQTSSSIFLPPVNFTHPYASEDPPGDFFRIKLTCVLLETCGKSLIKVNTKSKFQRYYNFFQRYLFIKGSLPLGIDYTVKDVFEQLLPHYHRFSTLQQVDEHIRCSLKDERLDQDDDMHCTEDLEDDAVSRRAAGAEEDTESGNGSDNDHADEYNEMNSAEDFEDFHRGPANLEEMNEFDREIEMALAESVQLAKLQNVSKRADDNRNLPCLLLSMAADSDTDSATDRAGGGDASEDGGIGNGGIVGIIDRGRKNKQLFNESAEDEEFTDDAANESGEGPAVHTRKTKKLRVLVRKSKKDKLKTRTLKVPTDCKFTQSFIKREKNIKEEKQEVKKLVMQCMEKIDDADLKEKRNYLQYMFYMNSHKYAPKDTNGSNPEDYLKSRDIPNAVSYHRGRRRRSGGVRKGA